MAVVGFEPQEHLIPLLVTFPLCWISRIKPRGKPKFFLVGHDVFQKKCRLTPLLKYLVRDFLCNALASGYQDVSFIQDCPRSYVVSSATIRLTETMYQDLSIVNNCDSILLFSQTYQIEKKLFTSNSSALSSSSWLFRFILFFHFEDFNFKYY